MDWTDLAQDMGKWRSVVNTVTNLVPQQIGNFFTGAVN